MADVREMIIQHVLTEDIFMTRLRRAAVPPRERHRPQAAGGGRARSTRAPRATPSTRRIAPYYETINARAAQISNHQEKQKFLKALYENFYNAYNPKAADRLGIVYTPDEIVRFMIERADHLTFKHFGKTLGDPGVEILDPATGTGTFITELIEYLPPAPVGVQVPARDPLQRSGDPALLHRQPEHRVHLQAEDGRSTCRSRTSASWTRSTTWAFERRGRAPDGLSGDRGREHRAHPAPERAQRISVIIGNPPYNANQLNENENNKNREYPEIDQRIKETYIKHSTAQKTKLYDMYARFLRWASDRLDQNGIIAFVSNNSFLDARSYDGFRQGGGRGVQRTSTSST